MKNLWGLIINNEVIAIRDWTEACQRVWTKEPQFHDFNVNSDLIKKKYKIVRLKVTWDEK
jgi:hypothetical protein